VAQRVIELDCRVHTRFNMAEAGVLLFPAENTPKTRGTRTLAVSIQIGSGQ
jgi:hypothetical protein